MIKIYVLKPFENIDISTYNNLLSEYRKKKNLNIKIEKHLINSIMTEMLLIYSLKANDIETEMPLRIVRNKSGKPIIENSSIEFNLSHSKDYVCCVISNEEVGIDVEKINDRRKILHNRILTDEEIIEYQELEEDKKSEYIVKKWTIIESYYKISTDINDYKNIKKNNLDVYSKSFQFDGYYLTVASRNVEILNVELIFVEQDVVINTLIRS